MTSAEPLREVHRRGGIGLVRRVALLALALPGRDGRTKMGAVHQSASRPKHRACLRLPAAYVHRAKGLGADWIVAGAADMAGGPAVFGQGYEQLDEDYFELATLAGIERRQYPTEDVRSMLERRHGCPLPHLSNT
jgi:hypothetical protein